jgi:secreted PhoX family phosphatase
MPSNMHLNELVSARLSRRRLLRALGSLPLLSLPACATGRMRLPTAPTFPPVRPTLADQVTVPEGYSARVLISWGDPLFQSAGGAFDPDTLTRAEQELRFGINNDMLALFPIRPAYPEPSDTDRAILCANNEHFEAALTFPSLAARDAYTVDHLQAMYAALGVSIVELRRERGQWRPVTAERPGLGLNRRITPFTPVVFGGPASGHRWIRQAADTVARYEQGEPGTIACGTMVNCAGGKTPWGTYLTCEEGFPFYFSRSDENAAALRAAQADPAYVADGRLYTYPVPTERRLPLTPPQFDLSNNPTGPSLYGWVVEIDPYDSQRAPYKRTALGRRWNEGATTALARDGRVAVYMGDDSPNQFVYKFVTRRRFDPRSRAANLDLLDDGVLHVARYDADGGGEWLPITLETVTAAVDAAGYEPPFADLADVLMRTREAGRLLGATPMDRPEDIEPLLDTHWTGLGPVLINCTGSPIAKAATPANPRRQPGGEQPNYAGHIVRIDEDNEDAAATRFRWDIFALCGDPESDTPTRRSRTGREVHVSTEHAGMPTFAGDRFSSPDNLCFDSARNAWITTNGQASIFGDTNEGVVVLPLGGDGPRLARTFLVGPVGAELCGPTFAFDERAFFVAVQHPGDEDSAGASFAEQRWSGAARRPPSSWPRGGSSWPLPTVVVVTREDRGIIGT